MKKRLISICLLILLLFSFSACGEIESPGSTAKISDGAIDIIYGDTVFYYNLFDFDGSPSIKYQDINNVSDKGNPLLDDPLLEDGVNPFTNMGGLTLIAVDYEATEKNDGMPVLIIAYNDYSNLENVRYIIISFNTKTNEITEIKDDVYDNIQSLHVYGDIIYYTVNRGDQGYDICRVDTDGKNDTVKDNPEFRCNRILTVYEDKIYYLVEDLNRAYSCSLDFSEDTVLVSEVARLTAFAYDGYFYYPSGLKYHDVGNFTAISETVSRFPLSDPSATEVFIEDITSWRNCGSKFYYYEFTPRQIGDVTLDEGNNVLKVIDLNTMETDLVYDRRDSNTVNYCEALSDSWLYHVSYDYTPLLTDPSAQPIITYSAINTETFEEIILPR